jgi:hypothetical protein
MSRLLITSFLLLLKLQCLATCIAIFIGNNGHIYVAADSRRSFIFNDGKDGVRYESVCKIHSVGPNYFAISGFDDGGLLKAANKALTENTDIDTAINSFGTAMLIRYKHLMDEARKFYPAQFKHFLRDGLAEVSFFGFSNGVPNIINMAFFCSLDSNRHVATTYRKRHIQELTVIGMSKDIACAAPEELPTRDLMELNPLLYVEALVNIEVKYQPMAVGGPIDLLELKDDGPIWIRKNNNPDKY